MTAHLSEIGVGKDKATRAVIFAERVPTLLWLREKLCKDLSFAPDAVQILHGGLNRHRPAEGR